ncbi:MAG: hypothetical protein FWE41_04635 [Coriobacteriia bacterium]|nr:hypothetical protein [Coriobacteriia bacterium]MCL2749771.1 hypothetical protein [Coriobacteriia bacterium]
MEKVLYRRFIKEVLLHRAEDCLAKTISPTELLKVKGIHGNRVQITYGRRLDILKLSANIEPDKT